MLHCVFSYMPYRNIVDDNELFPQVKVLRSISPITRDNIILGQYAGDPNGEGDAKLSYLDDETVPKGSITPTYAMAALFIKNERWDGVPFIVKCGKGKTLCCELYTVYSALCHLEVYFSQALNSWVDMVIFYLLS